MFEEDDELPTSGKTKYLIEIDNYNRTATAKEVGNPWGCLVWIIGLAMAVAVLSSSGGDDTSPQIQTCDSIIGWVCG